MSVNNAPAAPETGDTDAMLGDTAASYVNVAVEGNLMPFELNFESYLVK